MNVGKSIRYFRVAANLSQGELERRTGLQRTYLSRVENGHTVPEIPTLETIARALGMELYQLLYDGDLPPTAHPRNRSRAWGSTRKDKCLAKLLVLLPKMREGDREVLLFTLEKLVQVKTRNPHGNCSPKPSETGATGDTDALETALFLGETPELHS